VSTPKRGRWTNGQPKAPSGPSFPESSINGWYIVALLVKGIGVSVGFDMVGSWSKQGFEGAIESDLRSSKGEKDDI
jgi:hypothetical protein